jgi:hypothetical protein
MANDNPTCDGCAVALKIEGAHLPFLTEVFESARGGLLEDLANPSGRMRNPERSRREAETFGRLLVGLRTGSLVPDPCFYPLLVDLARVIDEDNEYSRAVIEHNALQALIGQVEPYADEGR